MIKKWSAAGAIFIIISFVIYGLVIGGSNNTNTTLNGVETETLHKQEMSKTVIVPGNLILANEQIVPYQSDKGVVEEILLQEGDKVKNGDNLLRYKNESLLNKEKQNQLHLELGYLELDNIQKKHEKMDKELKKDENNEGLQAEHDDIKIQEQVKFLEIKQLQFEKNSIEQELANTTVKSDIDGTVIFISKNSLSSLEQHEQQPLMHIALMENMIFKGKISENDILKIKEGQIVKLSSDTIPNESWEGTISFISDIPEQYATEESYKGANYTVEAKISSNEVPLKPGFRMLMEVETDKEVTYTLPLSAVQRDSETDYVYVVENGVAIRKEIETGIATHEAIEIKDGLTENDEVILNTEEVIEGMEVSLQ